jgi:hypothetical protein
LSWRRQCLKLLQTLKPAPGRPDNPLTWGWLLPWYHVLSMCTLTYNGVWIENVYVISLNISQDFVIYSGLFVHIILTGKLGYTRFKNLYFLPYPLMIVSFPFTDEHM